MVVWVQWGSSILAETSIFRLKHAVSANHRNKERVTDTVSPEMFARTLLVGAPKLMGRDAQVLGNTQGWRNSMGNPYS